MIYVYPKGAEITPEQKAWIENYFREFEAALLSPTFSDPINGYAHYIDVDSFVDFLIMQELLKNIDGYRISSYMYKDRLGKLNMGPVWDFDLSTGNAYYYGGCDTDGWVLKTALPESEGYKRPFWWSRLLEDPAFVTKVVMRWNELRKPGLSVRPRPWMPELAPAGPFVTPKVLAVIDTAVATLSGPQERNFAQWHTLGRYLWPNCKIPGSNPAAYYKTFEAEMTALKSWITLRLAWLDANITTIGP